jgi:Uma2 family endonuclease
MLTGSVRIDDQHGGALPYDRVVTEAIAFTPFESYLDREQLAERRHELVGGRVYALAGGSERHDLAAGLIYEALAPGARSSGCRPFTSNRLVRTRGGNGYYPDVMVACGPAAHRLYETDPAVIVEVLSPSTGDLDRREKAVAYAESTSLALLLLVDPGNRRIEVARPAGGRIHDWTVYGPGDVVSTAFGDLDVDAICDAVDQTATTT